jgi:alcohol-forming fatty acyl-CoA reductase
MFKKIVPVFGDVTSKQLGLSDEQYDQVISSTQIVFHMAASLKLEATLKPNVEMNLTGTKNVLDVCKKMPNIMALVHLSTAFCNCDQEVLREEVYDCPQKPTDLIRCAEWMSEEAMDIMGRKLISPHPNTCKFYCYENIEHILIHFFMALTQILTQRDWLKFL